MICGRLAQPLPISINLSESSLFDLIENPTLPILWQESKRLSEEAASKVDSLRAELAESQSAASKAGDKISRLEETAAERSARLESMQRANEKLEADLRSKVGKF